MQDHIAKGLQTALSGYAALVTVLGGTFVYRNIAPEDKAQPPYVIYQFNNGGYDNDNPRDSVDTFWVVKGVSLSDAQAGSIATRINEALHEQDLTLGSAWKTYDCEEVDFFEMVETRDQRAWHHRGGIYRVRAVRE